MGTKILGSWVVSSSSSYIARSKLIGFSLIVTLFLVLLVQVWSPTPHTEWVVVHVISGAQAVEMVLWRFLLYGKQGGARDRGDMAGKIYEYKEKDRKPIGLIFLKSR